MYNPGFSIARRLLLVWLHCEKCKDGGEIIYFLLLLSGGFFWGGGVGLGPGPVVSVKGALNGSAHQNILQNFLLATLWMGIGGWFLPVSTWLRTSAKVKVHGDMAEWSWCGRTWLTRTAFWPQPKEHLWHDYSGDFEPGLLVQHQCLTSQRYFWKNGQKFP